jgi:hypothetical protein
MASVIAKYAEARRLAELADSGEADRIKAR